MPIKSQKKLKFPILNNVEFVSIFKNKKSVLESDGTEFEGKTWREFQLILGEKLPSDDYFFTMKFKNNPEVHTGKIRAASLNYKPLESNSMETDKIITEFKSLKDALSKATNQGGVSFEMLLASTKQGYEAQVTYLNLKYQTKTNYKRIKKSK